MKREAPANQRETYYRKVGRRYVPAFELDPTLTDALPIGVHLQVVRPNGMSRRYNVDPNFAAILAAAMLLEDRLVDIIFNAINRLKIDGAYRDVELERELNDVLNRILERGSVAYYASGCDVTREVLDVIARKASELMDNPAIKEAYDHFLLTCKLHHGVGT